MKFKTSAIALAVAGTVAAPIAAQAEGEVYASARVGIENTDTAGTSDLRVKSFSSRFGVRGETDLGNGMTGFGRYEWDVDFNDSDTPGASEDDIGLRHRYVGLKGDFGSVTLGQTYHTFYNMVVGPLDNPWWSSGYAMVEYRSRTDNSITYAGGSGNLMFGLTGVFQWDTEEEAPDQIEAGLSFGLGDLGTIGVAIINQADDYVDGSAQNDEDIIGIAWSGIALGDATLGVSVMEQDDDRGFVLDLGIANAYVHVEMLEVDSSSGSSMSGSDEDKIGITLGYTQSLGRNTTMWYEVHDLDNDTGNSDDDLTAVRAVLKYDIL